MSLETLFHALADVLDTSSEIERLGQAELVKAATLAKITDTTDRLPAQFFDVMSEPDAHPVCKTIATTPLPWAPPQTSNDPGYLRHSAFKAHVELLGPGGLAKSHRVRLGIYGILPNSEYGIRTHPAEEVFIMLAGMAFWKRGSLPYQPAIVGDRSHHPSMLPHATRTSEKAFLSIYIWSGDISTENYRYVGSPQTDLDDL